MSYNNPRQPQSYPQFVGLDKVLQSLVDDFNQVDYLTGAVFRRVRINVFPEAVTDEKITSPLVYIGDGEYYDASINDMLPCAMFFQARGNETTRFTKQVSPSFFKSDRQCSLVFWMNLKRLAGHFPGDYIFTENVKLQFMKILMKNSSVKSIEEYVDEPISQIFDGFSIEEENQYDKFPFASFRINFTVEFETSARC